MQTLNENIIYSKKPHELLLQSPPFLFIDSIEYYDNENNILICKKLLSYNEPYFGGHFPSNPIVPGVLLIEMAAQAGNLLIIAELNKEEENIGYLAKVKKFNFINTVVPGETLDITVQKKERVGGFITIDVTITSGKIGKKVAKGELVLFL